MEIEAAALAFQALLEHTEEHFAAKVAKSRRFVGVNGESVRSDFHIFFAQLLSTDHDLDDDVLLDIRDSVDHLKLKIRI